MMKSPQRQKTKSSTTTTRTFLHQINILIASFILFYCLTQVHCEAFQPEPPSGGPLPSASTTNTRSKMTRQQQQQLSMDDDDGSKSSPKSDLSFKPLKRPLPTKVIIGYATTCNDKVKVAIRQGVNVVIWSFMELVKINNVGQRDDEVTSDDHTSINAELRGSLDLNCIREFIKEMDNEGYDDTVHLVAFGGWNGPHVDTTKDCSGFQTADEWYKAWKHIAGDIFHGIDWDPEGDDNLQASTNYFTLSSLNMMGEISHLAKQDGYIVSMAPAQSYLDIESNGSFSRYVNLTDPTRTSGDKDKWHDDFHYFGQNVYAYLLAKYGNYIDIISIQFYESYSRAGLTTIHHKVPQEAYLSNYIQELMNKQQQYYVKFEQDDHQVDLKNQYVSIPLSKLVWGFANGWATSGNHDSDKVVYFLPECIQAAYQNLVDWQMEPRGFMFWVIDEEGDSSSNGVYYSKELNDILHIRNNNNNNNNNDEMPTTASEMLKMEDTEAETETDPGVTQEEK